MNSNSISKSKILSLYIEYPVPKDKLSKEALGISDLILTNESIHPISKPEKTKLEAAYISSNQQQWRAKRDDGINFNKGKAFERTPQTQLEEQIKINIDNILLFNKQLSFPLDQPAFYLKNKQINTIFGPITSNQFKDFLASNQISASNCEFRPIDIYSFKNMQLFSFIPLLTINDEKWVENIMDNPLLQHTILFKTTQNLVEFQPKELQKKKPSRDEKESKNQKEAIIEEKEQEPIIKKDFQQVKNEETKENIKEIQQVIPITEEDIKEDKLKQPIEPSMYIKPEDDIKWEDPNKKKRKVRPGQKKDNTSKPPLDVQSNKSMQNTILQQQQQPTIQDKPTGAKDVITTLKQKYEDSENKKRQLEKEALKEANSQKEIKDHPKDDEGFEVISPKKNKKQKKRPVEANVNLGFKY